MKKRFWSIVFVLAICGCAVLAVLGLAGAAEVNWEFFDNFTQVEPVVTYTQIARNSSGEDTFVLKVDKVDAVYSGYSPTYNVMLCDENQMKYSHDVAEEAVFDSQTNITTLRGRFSYAENAVGTKPSVGTEVGVATDALITIEGQKYYSKISDLVNATIISADGNSTVVATVPDWVLEQIAGVKPMLSHVLFQRQSNGSDFFSLAVTAGNITQYVNCWEALIYSRDPALTGGQNVTIDGQSYQEIGIMTVPHDPQNMDSTGVVKVIGDWYYYDSSCIPKTGSEVYIGAQAEVQNKLSKVSNLIAVKVPEIGEISENTTAAVGGDLSEAVITLDLENKTAVYTGNAIEPGVTVELNGAELKQDTDYTVEYKDNTEVGTAKVFAIGKGDYTGMAQTNFTIVAGEPDLIDISTAVITLENTSVVYTGETIEPAVTSVTLDGKTLDPKTDYDITYENNREIGTGIVIATGKGAYTGKAKGEFQILEPGKTDISTVVITLENNTMVYTGKALEPAVISVVLDDRTLDPKTDYDVSYENNIDAGKGTAVITGKGSFTGSGRKEFKIKKAKNKITVSPTKKTLKYAKLEKKNQTFKLTIKVLGKAKKTVKIKSVPKKVKQYFSINKATGKITVKKGIPKGTYKIKIQVTAAATKNYLKTTKIQQIKITIK